MLTSRLGTPWDKPWTFRCDPDALPSMAAAGEDVANLANNHGSDFGYEAMLDGIQNLRNVEIAPVGASANYAEAYTPVVMDINGWTIRTSVVVASIPRPDRGWHSTTPPA